MRRIASATEIDCFVAVPSLNVGNSWICLFSLPSSACVIDQSRPCIHIHENHMNGSMMNVVGRISVLIRYVSFEKNNTSSSGFSKFVSVVSIIGKHSLCSISMFSMFCTSLHSISVTICRPDGRIHGLCSCFLRLWIWRWLYTSIFTSVLSLFCQKNWSAHPFLSIICSVGSFVIACAGPLQGPYWYTASFVAMVSSWSLMCLDSYDRTCKFYKPCGSSR